MEWDSVNYVDTVAIKDGKIVVEAVRQMLKKDGSVKSVMVATLTLQNLALF